MPPEQKQGLEARVADLESSVLLLQKRLAVLERPSAAPHIIPMETTPESLIATDEDASEELLSWVGRSSLLPRISSICFLLVLALVLRTITDHEIIDQTMGSLLGMVYAATLIAVGWYQYQRKSALAPVFSACGAVLMAVIVVETHGRFQALSSTAAYMILLASGGAMALVSYRNRVTLPIILGTLGMSLAGVAIDYPNPVYPLLAALLLAANALGFGVTLLKRCSWLRWILLLLTIVMMTAWALKLGVKIPKGETAGLYPVWYLPSVAAIFLFFTAAATAAIFERGGLRSARFDLGLPLLSVLWAFPGTAFVISVSGHGLIGISLIGLLVGALYFGLMFRIGNRGPAQRGAGAFALGGSVVCALSIYTLFGDPLLPLPVLAAAALLFCHLADRWQHGALRLIASFVLVGSSTMFAYLVLTAQPPFGLWHSGIVAALLAAIGYGHYRASRLYIPATQTWFYGHYDPENRTMIVLLLATLVCSYFALRSVTHVVLASFLGPDPHTLVCADSAIINSGATALMLFAFFRDDKQIRNIAILITMIGAGKVFLFDLFSISGFPLIISVLIFGVAIFFQSIIFSNQSSDVTSDPQQKNESDPTE